MKKFLKRLIIELINIFKVHRKYNGNPIVENAKCCDCGKIFTWDEEVDEIYNDKYLCFECFDKKYGYCNECGELNKYSDMNEDIICKGCQK